VDIHRIFPTVVFIVVAFPLDKVLKSSPEHPTIEYSFNFVVFLSINQDRIWWRITPSPRNWIHRCRHQFDHQKDRVEMTHGKGQLETVGIRSDTMFYYIGAKEAVC
jgi:hypothetical protein